MISVLVLTLNEEQNLPRCLESVQWSDDVVVFDSFSTDRTVELARAAGARVYQRAFHGYGEQREAARTEVDYKHPWVLAVDADETVEPDLVPEIQAIAGSGKRPAGVYRVRRKEFFWGRWLKHAGLYPSWFLRFYRPEHVRYGSRSVHEYPEVDGPVGELRGHLAHHGFHKGLSEWMHKHTRYAELEAEENLRTLSGGGIPWRHGLALRDPVKRRRLMKELSWRTPCRPSLRFLYMYVLRFGFLDGWPGFTYCRLLSQYEYLVTLKMKESLRRAQGLTI
jgi:glycosyltransferase involved in cell wall biosynthesis